MTDTNERDSEGNLTDWELACKAMADHGCDCGCGEDEPGTCLTCVCWYAMQTERMAKEKAEAKVATLGVTADQQAIIRAAVRHRDALNLYVTVLDRLAKEPKVIQLAASLEVEHLKAATRNATVALLRAVGGKTAEELLKDRP